MFGNSPHNEDRGWQSERCRAYLEECVFPKMNGVFLIWQIHKYEMCDNKIKVFTFWKSRKLKQVCKRQWNTNCFSFVVLFQEFHWPIAIILRKHPQVFKNNTVYIFVSPIVKDRFFFKKKCNLVTFNQRNQIYVEMFVNNIRRWRAEKYVFTLALKLIIMH